MFGGAGGAGGRWPGFRTGQMSTSDSPGPAGALPAVASPAGRLGAPGKPLVAQRSTLSTRSTVLPARQGPGRRAPLTVAPSGVATGLTPDLTMAPPPGWSPGGTDAQPSGGTQPQPVAASHYSTVRREAARVAAASTPVQPAARASLLAKAGRSKSRGTDRSGGGPVAPVVGGRGVSAPVASRPGVTAPVVGPSIIDTPGVVPMWSPDPVAVQRVEATSDIPEPVTPEQRWRAAVSSVPLEAPRAFPTHMQPLVAKLTGRTGGARYTTGTATRRALDQVGAFGATTGSVVHLSQAPSMDPANLGVLAHELTHARTPISRPRFMLHNHTGHMDSDERQARTVGTLFDSNPVQVQRFSLPGGGSNLVSGLTNQAAGALGGLGHQATDLAGGLADRGRSVVSDGVNTAQGYVGDAAGYANNAVTGLRDRFTSAATGVSNDVASGIDSVSANLVNQLPVGGAGVEGVAGAVSQMARDAAQSAVQEATQLGQSAQGAISGLQGMANQGVSGLAGQADQMISGATGQVDQWVNGAVSQAQGAVQGVGDDVAQAVGGAENAAAGGINGVLNKAGNALGLGPGAVPQISGQDLDRIAEALEERLLRQLERRGGRYAGVF
ncbi:hypothetical protein GCM10029964_035550 [Kibdelosporangium lantanae]